VPDDPADLPPDPKPLDRDTLKGLYDLQRDTYNLLENTVKTLEDKGRNNVVAATGAVGFALLILKPDAIAQSAFLGFTTLASSLAAVLALGSLAALVTAAWLVVQIIRRNAHVQGLTNKVIVQSRWLYEGLPLELENNEQFLRTAASVYFQYGELVETIMERKSAEVKAQFVGLNRLIVLIFAYLGLGALVLAIRAAL
jgi:hypothetical protein